jgi:hypothetical protein
MDEPRMPGFPDENDAQYALDVVRKICTEVGPGLAGSPQERERAEVIKKELEQLLGAENVVVEEFSLAPGAFLGSQLISTLFMLVAVLLNILAGHLSRFSPRMIIIAALIFSISAILVFLFEFVITFELVDPVFKKKTSQNVIGTLRKPGGHHVNRLLIFSGHHDSALEFTWLRYTGYGFLVLSATWLISLVTVLVVNIIRLVGLFIGSASLIHAGTLGWILLIYPIVPSIIYAVFFARGSKNGGSVPGAADNLSACSLVLAICRFLMRNPSFIPDDTEIRFITFGSEEAGVRGSRRYVQRHLDELKRLDVRLLNFETIVHREIAILTSESSGSVKNSPEMVKSVVTAAQRAEIPFTVQPATLGTGSDAGPFSRAGLKATTLLGFKVQQMVAFYHQERDTPEILTIEPLLNVLRLALEWIRNDGD